jgi:hypothetical protein
VSAVARLGWYRRRLGLMEPAEVVLHARRDAAARLDAATWSLSRDAWARRWEPPDSRLFGAVVRDEPLGLVTRERAAILRREAASAAESIVEEARRRASGEVTLFGYPPFAVAVDWDGHTDPLTGARWPRKHGRLIDFRYGVDANPKLVWELHRCQELPLLVLASHIDDDVRLADAAVDRLTSWISRHPPGRGIAWANTFEAGLRALSLALAFDGLRGSGRVDEATARRVLRSLWQHARWIEGGLSRHSSANNHLLGELLGLLAVGVLAPELSRSDGWAAAALREIEAQARLQILPDGAGAEQSFGYWVFVLDLLLVAAALLRARERDVPGAILDAVERGGDCLALLIQGDEPDPCFGDSDDGRALLLDATAGRSGRTLAAAIAACSGHRYLHGIAPPVDATAIVLFGEAGMRRRRATAAAPPPSSGVLADAGITVLRLGGMRALFDAGALGYLSIAAHGHADALSLVLSCGSQEVVVDPGTGSYVDPDRRRSFRGTAAHATVLLDGRDQSEQGGPFFWLRHANARLVEWDPVERVALGEQDGYLGLPDPVSHRRAVVPMGGRALLVVDRLDARSTHSAVQNWPLHPACSVAARSAHAVDVGLPDGRDLVIALASTCGGAIVVDNDGLWSRRLEAWEPAPRCAQTAVLAGVAHLAALISPAELWGSAEPCLRLDVEEGGDSIVARARLGGRDRAVPLSLGGR